MLTGLFSNKPRAFAFTFNVTESKIELYEILATADPAYLDNEDTPITQVFETAALFKDDVKPRYQMASLRNGEFSLSNVQGPVYIRVYYKSDQSCWVPWHSFGICASADSEQQYFPRLSLGEPTSDYCDAIVNSPLRDGYTFQFRFEITGKCRFVHARFMTVPIPTPQFRPPLCEPVGTCNDRDCEAITGVAPFSDLTIYNLQDRLYFNGTPLSFIENCPSGYYCPPGLFPRTFTYPPGTFSIYLPPCCTGFPIVLTKQGCQSSVSVTLPSTATGAQIQVAGADVIAQIAAQQAKCDAISISGPRLPAVITLSALTEYTCEDAVFVGAIHATGGTAPYTFSSSDLPAWMTASSSATTTTLSGTPPTIGVYTFTINVTSAGAIGSRTYTLNVVGIATASLANGTEGVAYSQTMTAPSIPGTLTWSVSDATLPPGLSLDTGTGEIYGTPTEADTFAFTISVTNGEVFCHKDFTIEIASSGGCAEFANLVWNAGVSSDIGTGTSSGTCLAENFNIQAQEPGGTSGLFTPSDPQKGDITFTAGFNYTGPTINCCMDFTFNGTAPVVAANPSPNGNTFYLILLKRSGVQFATTGIVLGTGSPQVVNFPYTVPDCSGGNLIEVVIRLLAQGSAGFGNPIPAMTATIVGSLGEC